MGKWQVPDYIFNGIIFPPFLNGAGYVMSRSTATCLYANGIKIPYFHLEVRAMMLKEKRVKYVFIILLICIAS